MIRSCIAAVLLVVMSTGVVGAAPGDDLGRQFEVVRTVDGPASFEIIVGMAPPAGTGDMDAFVGTVGFRTDDDGSVEEVVGLGATSIGRTDEPAVFVDGEEVANTCTAANSCRISATIGANTVVGYSDDGGADQLNRFYLVFSGADLEVKFDGNGWQLRETRLTSRFMDYRESTGAGVGITSARGADVFFGTEATGGARGSIAQAMAPCSTSTVSAVGRGAGMLTLSGGPDEPTVLCPSVGTPIIADHASSETTWNAHGAVVGDNSLAETRLFVIDLPRCDQLIPGKLGAVRGVTCPAG